MERRKFCDLNINWSYQHSHVDISMDDYVIMALQKLYHTSTKHSPLAPPTWTELVYGKKCQYAKDVDTSNLLGVKGIKRVQRVVDVFVYYVCTVDNTTATVLNGISVSQSKPTQQ